MQFNKTIAMLTNPISNNIWNLIIGGNQHLTSVLLLTIISLIMINQCAPTDNFPYCLHCDDFNRESKVECVTTYQDCGHCKSGFIQDEEDSRLCYAIEILEDPVKDIVQRTGSEVILNCIFNAKVWCVWTKDTNQVEIGRDSTYQYLSADAGKTKAYDCSIRIEHLSMDDIGQWQCQSMAEDNIDSVKGRASQISIKHDEDKLIPTIKLNHVIVSYKEIKMSELQGNSRHRRDLVGQLNMLECHVAVTPAELCWEIEGNVILGGKLTGNRIQLDNNHLLQAMETHTAPVIKLTCLAEYESEQILTSYVIIRVEDQIDSNEQPRENIQLTESSALDVLSDVVLQKTLSNNGNFDSKPIQISILASVTVLVVIMVIIFIASMTVVIVKLKCCRKKN